MGVPLTEGEEQEQPTSPNAFGPKLYNMSDQEDDSGFLSPKPKKTYNSSDFYDEPKALYPTVEEQVERCRKIADSLSDDCNKKSRGANMFFKRVMRAEKWVVPSPPAVGSSESQYAENSVLDPSAMPYVRISRDPLKLKLLLDPRHIVDLKRLREEGVQIVEHNAVGQDLCHSIVKDLNSPTGKGAQLFAKRKKKSMEWVVDEDKVKAHLRQMQDRERGIFTPEPPSGYFDGSLRPVSCGEVAETVIRAAEAKVMSYPAPRHSAIESSQYFNETPEPLPQYRLTSVQSSANLIPSYKSGIYSCRAPRGWTSVSAPRTTSMHEMKSEDMPSQFAAPSGPSHNVLSHNFPTTRTYSFSNFNTTPKAWSSVSSSDQSKSQIKKVRPPSVLVQ